MKHILSLLAILFLSACTSLPLDNLKQGQHSFRALGERGQNISFSIESSPCIGPVSGATTAPSPLSTPPNGSDPRRIYCDEESLTNFNLAFSYGLTDKTDVTISSAGARIKYQWLGRPFSDARPQSLSSAVSFIYGRASNSGGVALDTGSSINFSSVLNYLQVSNSFGYDFTKHIGAYVGASAILLGRFSFQEQGRNEPEEESRSFAGIGGFFGLYYIHSPHKEKTYSLAFEVGSYGVPHEYEDREITAPVYHLNFSYSF